MKVSRVLSGKNLRYVIISLFWYLALFPGRIGYDYSEAFRIMQSGKSTDLWTGIFFNFLRVASLNGQVLFLASGILLSIYGVSIKYLVESLPIKEKNIRNILTFFYLSPFYGNFGLTVSHDVTQTSGILILIGLNMRMLSSKSLKKKEIIISTFCAFLFTSTVRTGLALIILQTLILYFKFKYRKIGVILLFTIILVQHLFSIGITKYPSPINYSPIIADIKCVTQHSEARISSDEWTTLLKINTKDKWTKPYTCANSDEPLKVIDLSNLNKISKNDLLKVYFEITIKNPAIVTMAHIQRSNVALPPPFFQPPKNQISWDIEKPIGAGTNIALQEGPELLHPSIDEPSLKINFGFWNKVQNFFLLPSFLINQASWFWGWGGFWLWPMLFALIRFSNKIKDILYILSPILLNHGLLFILAPSSLPRYVYSTIVFGIICMMMIINSYINRIRSENRRNSVSIND